MHSRFRRLALTMTLAVTSIPSLVLLAPQAASGACARQTTNHVNGFVVGEDGRDVNFSIGFDVLDAYGRKIDVNPASSTYGCVISAAYSRPQVEYNHWVGYQGVPQNYKMVDGTYTKRFWNLPSLPSNAAKVWIEVYSRAWTAFPSGDWRHACRDSAGNLCFNPGNVNKYGYANRHEVKPNTINLWIRLPMRCNYRNPNGTYGSDGDLVVSSGTALTRVMTWTKAYGGTPPLQGWGSGGAINTAKTAWRVQSLASRQHYSLWATKSSGVTVKKDVYIYPCKTTNIAV